MMMTTEPVEYKLVEVSSEASRSPHRSPRRPRQVPRTPPRNQGAPANMNVLPKGTKVYLSEGTVAYVVRQCSTGEYEIHVPSVSSNFRATRDEFSLKWPVPVQETETYEPKSPTRSSQATMQAATPAQQSFDDPWRAKPPQEPQRNFYGMQHPDPIHNGNGQPNGNGLMASQGKVSRVGYQSENRAQQPSRSVWARSPEEQVSRSGGSRLNPNSPEWKTSTRSEPPRQAQARPEPRSMATQNIASQLSQQNSRDFNNHPNPASHFDGKNDWLSVSSRSPRSPPSRRQAPKRPKGSAPPGLGPRQPTRSRNPNTASSGQRRTAPPAQQQETRAPRTPQRARPAYKSQSNSRVNLPTGPKNDQKMNETIAPSISQGRKQPVEYFKNTCRHFLSDEGCRRGSKCRFYHPGEQTKVNKDEFCTIAANGARDEGDNFSRPRGRKSGKAQRQRYEACDL